MEIGRTRAHLDTYEPGSLYTAMALLEHSEQCAAELQTQQVPCQGKLEGMLIPLAELL